MWLVTLRAWYRLGEPPPRTSARSPRCTAASTSSPPPRPSATIGISPSRRRLRAGGGPSSPRSPRSQIPRHRRRQRRRQRKGAKRRRDRRRRRRRPPDVARAEARRRRRSAPRWRRFDTPSETSSRIAPSSGGTSTRLTLRRVDARGCALPAPRARVQDALEETKRREAIEAKIARKAAQRAAQRAAARGAVCARGGREISAKPAAASAVPLKPREPRPRRLPSPIPSCRVLPRLPRARKGDRAVGSHAGARRVSSASAVSVAAVQARASRPTRWAPRRTTPGTPRSWRGAWRRCGDEGRLPRRPPKKRPKETRDRRGGGPRRFGGFGLDGRAGAPRVVRRRRRRPPAPDPRRGPPSRSRRAPPPPRPPRRRTGGKTALDLPPKERGAGGGVVVRCVRCRGVGGTPQGQDGEHPRRPQHGTPPLAPRRAKPKPDGTGGRATRPRRRRSVRTADTLIEWVRKASDRESFLRHRPIARDETGRAYHALGGSAGAGMRVQRPTGRRKPRDAPPRIRTTRRTPRPAPAGAVGVKTEGEGGLGGSRARGFVRGGEGGASRGEGS